MSSCLFLAPDTPFDSGALLVPGIPLVPSAIRAPGSLRVTCALLTFGIALFSGALMASNIPLVPGTLLTPDPCRLPVFFLGLTEFVASSVDLFHAFEPWRQLLAPIGS